MNKKITSIFVRKLMAALLTTALTSIYMAGQYVLNAMELGTLNGLFYQFFVTFCVYSLYVGAIVFIFGNAVSLALEGAHHKWFKSHGWLYVMLHGVFGLLIEVVFPYTGLAIYGMAAALAYGCIDRLLWIRMSKNKSTKAFLLIPILLFGLYGGYFYVNTSVLPTFTVPDASTSATSSP